METVNICVHLLRVKTNDLISSSVCEDAFVSLVHICSSSALEMKQLFLSGLSCHLFILFREILLILLSLLMTAGDF